MRSRVLAPLGAVLLVGSATPALCAPVQFQFTTGYSYASGTFEKATTTTTQAVVFSANARYGNWSLGASVPWLHLHGPGNDVALASDIGGAEGEGMGSTETEFSGSGLGATPTSRSGVGDTSIALNYADMSIFNSPYYAVFSASLLAPSGDHSKGLGVGVVDFGLSTSVGRSLGNFSYNASIGYTFRGNVAGKSDRLDSVRLLLNGSYKLSPEWQIGAFAGWAQKSSAAGSAQERAGAYIGYAVSSNVSLRLNVEPGFAKSSPDIATSLMLSWSL